MYVRVTSSEQAKLITKENVCQVELYEGVITLERRRQQEQVDGSLIK